MGMAKGTPEAGCALDDLAVAEVCGNMQGSGSVVIPGLESCPPSRRRSLQKVVHDLQPFFHLGFNLFTTAWSHDCMSATYQSI
jgi:hypothetical protein